MKQTFLITGAANGLGQALAKSLTHENHQLILLDNDLNALNALYDELDAQTPNQIYLYPMDLKGANPDDYAELAQVVSEQFDSLEGLYLNATILPAFTPIEYFDIAQWYEVMQVNLNANFHLIQNLLPALKKRQQSQKSHLVAMLDATLNEHPAFYGTYGVAKAGLAQLVKTTAAENTNTALTCYLAHLPPFQSHLRAHLFPGENIEHLPTPDEITKIMTQLVLENLSSEWMEKL